ncbi:MAG: peptide-methionine (S)-S-oxide reductase [Acinetobacter sp.]|nr:peptide-methionine (S)-S-oxide reductase [Acinetobacter sp.]
MSSSTSIITLGGGCFWCLDAVFREVPGVSACVSGYAGGPSSNPTYEQICTGTSGHAEVVQLHFDPEQISLQKLLTIFFTIHDPSTLNRQGNDIGTQYRSVIFCQDNQQRQQVESFVKDYQANQHQHAAIVTEVCDAVTFWPAEDYHQDFFRKNPGQGYCQFVVAPKLHKYRQLAGSL